MWKLKRKRMLRVSVRTFNREMYSYLDKLPLVVYNKRTKKDLFKITKL